VDKEFDNRLHHRGWQWSFSLLTNKNQMPKDSIWPLPKIDFRNSLGGTVVRLYAIEVHPPSAIIIMGYDNWHQSAS